jgi:hypothetical protein
MDVLNVSLSIIRAGIDCTHFQTRVVGDLPREEAHKYFLHVLKNDQNLTLEDRNRLKSMDFSIPFKLSGGMMLFIRSYIQQVKDSGYFEDRTFKQ